MQNKYKKINIYTDGGSRGNPGLSAIGIIVLDENENEVWSLGKKIGITTNNIAEYTALLEAIRWLKENENLIEDGGQATFYMDSELVCKQITGIYKIRNENLKKIYFQISTIIASLKQKPQFFNVQRMKNYRADRMVNMALDNKL